MTPPASVSGLHFSHPQAHDFGVGKIERDQVEDYARRKNWDLQTAEPLAGADPQLHAAGGGGGPGTVSATAAIETLTGLPFFPEYAGSRSERCCQSNGNRAPH